MIRFWNTLRNFMATPGRQLRTIENQLATMGRLSEGMRYQLSDIHWQAVVNPNGPAPPNPPLYHFGYRVYSQNDEDGILAEIFRRIDCKTRWFVEFGVHDGMVNNTCHLLAQGWRGGWIEMGDKFVAAIRQNFAPLLAANQLRLKPAFITAENISELFRELEVPTDLDLLSIDIDGNDYWVWKALAAYRPRCVVVEYNAGLGPLLPWVKSYDAQSKWDGSRNFGASLKALELLGRELGYSLVGCNFSGVNAFFVRDDLLQDLFPGPSSSEHHFRPPRYYWTISPGHPPNPREMQGVLLENRQ